MKKKSRNNFNNMSLPSSEEEKISLKEDTKKYRK